MPIAADNVKTWQDGVLTEALDFAQIQNALIELIGSIPGDIFGLTSVNAQNAPMVPSLTGTVGAYFIHIGGAGQSCYLLGKPVPTTVDADLAIPINSTSQVRIDYVIAQPTQAAQFGSSRQKLVTPGNPYSSPPVAPVFTTTTFADQAQTCTYQYLQGTAGSGPPSVPTGWVAIAQITLPASNAALTSANISSSLPMPGALLSTFGVYNPRSYGALGNGSNDDTMAIQAAVNACIAGGGGTVYLPVGAYIISQPIALASGSNFALIGSGQGSIIQANGDFDILQIQSGSPGFLLENIALVGFSATGAFYTQGAAVHCESAFTSGGFRFRNISTTGCGYGLKFDQQGGGRNVVEGSVIKGNLMGIWTKHDMHVVESDIKGGTYGIVCDNTQEGFQVHTCRLFGVCSLLVTNTTGNPTIGNSIKMVNCEANYSPPPQAGGGSPVAATGTVTFTGTPTTTQSYSILIGQSGGIQSPVAITVAENTGDSLSTTATNAANAINNSAIGPSGSNPLVTATASGGVVTLTSIEMGDGANNVSLSVVSSAALTLVPSGSHLTGGADTGIWPGDAGDPLSSLPGASVVSTCDYNFAAAVNQLHFVDSWGSSIIIGSSLFGGPKATTLAGGSYNASVKGKNRGTFYAIDVQQLSTQGGKGTFAMVGGVAQALAGTALNGIIHLGQGCVNATITGVQLNNQQGNNPAIVIDDATGSCDISVSNCPMIGTNPSISPVQFYAALGTAVMPSVVVRNCPGFNGVGQVVAISTGAWTTGQVLTNNYGVDGYIVLAGGSSVVVSIYDQLTNSYTASLLSTGVSIPFPAQSRIKVAFSGAPSAAQFVCQ